MPDRRRDLARRRPVSYAEIVSTISARSAGPGTRQNIDEFTLSTARALETVGGAAARQGDHPPEPRRPADRDAERRSTPTSATSTSTRSSAVVDEAVAAVAAYVPGYRLTAPPLLRDGVVTVLLEVEGAGDYLPEYAGNLDIMTSGRGARRRAPRRAGAAGR